MGCLRRRWLRREGGREGTAHGRCFKLGHDSSSGLAVLLLPFIALGLFPRYWLFSQYAIEVTETCFSLADSRRSASNRPCSTMNIFAFGFRSGSIDVIHIWTNLQDT